MVVVLDLTDVGALERQWREFLCRGGAFVRGARMDANAACELSLRLPGGDEVRVAAHAVWIADDGVGFQLDGFDRATRTRLEQRVEAAVSEDRTNEVVRVEASDTVEAVELADDTVDTDADTVDAGVEADDDHGGGGARAAHRGVPSNVHERVRNLSIVEQHRMARDGEVHERIALERLYGKQVWEPLLRNPRLSVPEVARMARMGTMPRPLMEIIVGNAMWLRNPEVRRALLANPRLSPDQIPRVLRLLNRAELRLVPTQTAYPVAVRTAARQLLRESAGGS